MKKILGSGLIALSLASGFLMFGKPAQKEQVKDPFELCAKGCCENGPENCEPACCEDTEMCCE